MLQSRPAGTGAALKRWIRKIGQPLKLIKNCFSGNINILSCLYDRKLLCLRACQKPFYGRVWILASLYNTALLKDPTWRLLCDTHL